MPHIVVEYSANLRERIGLHPLLERLHETAIATGVFPLGGTRTRARSGSPQAELVRLDPGPALTVCLCSRSPGQSLLASS